MDAVIWALGTSLVLGALLGGLAVFLLYPAYARVRAALADPAGELGPPPRSVSWIVAVRNGEALVGPKLANLRARAIRGIEQEIEQEIVVASDGSTDGTLSALSEAAGDDLRVVALDRHEGKARALNAAVAASRGEVLAFTDADALLAEGALEALLAPLEDVRVGGVCGQRRIAERDGALAGAQSDYVSLDSRIKRWESARGRLTSNDGKLYALRRSAFRPVPDGVTDDLWSCLQAIRAGHRFAFAPDAVAEIRLPSRDPAHEVGRRRRIVSRSLRGIWLERELFLPWRHGDYGAALFVNKVLRRLLPLFAVAFVLGSGLLALEDTRFAWLLVPPAVLVTLALAAPLARRGPAARATGAARYLLLGLAGTALGVLDFLRGRSPTAWDPRKQDPAGDGELRLAYLVSRFPKVTETFVLHEVAGLLERGIDVEVFPLRAHDDGVRHAEVEQLGDRVHQAAPASREVLGAFARSLALRPVATLAAFARGLACAGWSANHLAGLVAFFPKATWIAERARARGRTHLHAHFVNHPTMAAAVVARLTGLPYGFTAHGSDLHVRQAGLAAKLRHATWAFTISDYNRSFAEHAVGPELAAKLEVQRCGVDTARFHPVPRRAGAGPLRIVCVAALRTVKGHRVLLDAVRGLRDQGVEFELELIGDGPERAALESRVASACLEDRVHFAGPLPGDLVRERLARSDVAVLASVPDAAGRREGIPVSLMEAMACGLPVVSSRLSGIPELVAHGTCGLLVDPGDANGLARALARLAQDAELRASLGAAARARVLERYDLAAGLDRLVARFTALRDAPTLSARTRA